MIVGFISSNRACFQQTDLDCLFFGVCLSIFGDFLNQNAQTVVQNNKRCDVDGHDDMHCLRKWKQYFLKQT